MRRGSDRDAAQLVRAIIANHDEQTRTAHDIAAQTTDRDQLPERVNSLLGRHTDAVRRRQRAYRRRIDAIQGEVIDRQRWLDRHLSRSRERSLDYGLEL
ncbi:MAG: hypothetical protein JO106_12455 [Mycobacterium sp.]|nr:hypothetical protein [Mycobacterium sp.]